jgi:hypothetical protein
MRRGLNKTNLAGQRSRDIPELTAIYGMRWFDLLQVSLRPGPASRN